MSLLKSGAHPEGAFSLHLNRADTERFLPDKTTEIPKQNFNRKKTEVETNVAKIHNTPSAPNNKSPVIVCVFDLG